MEMENQVSVTKLKDAIAARQNFLCQNIDGSWGEICHSYNHPKLKEKRVITPSQRLEL